MSAAADQQQADEKEELVFVTGNAGKLREVRAILGGDGGKEAAVADVRVTSHKLDLPELQGAPEEVSKEKCRIAFKAMGGQRSVIVEDTSLCYNALNGLPGVYIKWFLQSIGHEGLNKIVAAYEDKSAYAQCIFALMRVGDANPSVFVGRCPGKIVPPRGPSQAAFGWDPVFEPDEGGGLTFAEMSSDAKNAISHRRRALQKLKAALQSSA